MAKIWFLQNPDDSRGFIAGFLNFNLATNAGIAFGLPLNRAIAAALAAGIILVLPNFLIKAYRHKNLAAVFSLSLIIAGAISNLIDRINFGYVIDYISVPFFTVFNLADAMISGGVVILLLQILFFTKTRQEKNIEVE